MTEGERATENKLAATVGCPEFAAVGVVKQFYGTFWAYYDQIPRARVLGLF